MIHQQIESFRFYMGKKFGKSANQKSEKRKGSKDTPACGCVSHESYLPTDRQALGGKAKILACGGASLPSHLEDFYEMLGVPITVGYGLTETSPVIAMRLVERNTPGTCGPPVYSCDLKVVDEETGETLPPLQRGLIKVRVVSNAPLATSSVRMLRPGVYACGAGNPRARALESGTSQGTVLGCCGFFLTQGEYAHWIATRRSSHECNTATIVLVGVGGGGFNVVQGEEGGSSDLRRQGSSNGLRSPGVPASIHVTTL